MSEGSLHPFGVIRLRRSFPGALKRALGRLAGRARRPEKDPEPDPALRSLAVSTIESYAQVHAALFERARRLGEKAERLEGSGTPSESANNRAERARRELQAGLAAVRASFVESQGESEGGRAFDLEVERRYPSLALPGSDL